jgi:hypothetical protein
MIAKNHIDVQFLILIKKEEEGLKTSLKLKEWVIYDRKLCDC